MSQFSGIARRKGIVHFRGHEIELNPLSVGFIMGLTERFKTVAAGLEGGDLISGLLDAGDKALGACIAFASGTTEAEIEELAFSADETVDFVKTILDISFPTAESLGKFMAQAGDIVARVASALGLMSSKG